MQPNSCNRIRIRRASRKTDYKSIRIRIHRIRIRRVSENLNRIRIRKVFWILEFLTKIRIFDKKNSTGGCNGPWHEPLRRQNTRKMSVSWQTLLNHTRTPRKRCQRIPLSQDPLPPRLTISKNTRLKKHPLNCANCRTVRIVFDYKNIRIRIRRIRIRRVGVFVEYVFVGCRCGLW